jgi:predicted RNA-binding protein associated with RNAse of E/G family
VTPDELRDAAAIVGTLVTRCKQVASEQHPLHEQHLTVSRDGYDLTTYLFQDVNWTYPAVTAVTMLNE